MLGVYDATIGQATSYRAVDEREWIVAVHHIDVVGAKHGAKSQREPEIVAAMPSLQRNDGNSSDAQLRRHRPVRSERYDYGAITALSHAGGEIERHPLHASETERREHVAHMQAIHERRIAPPCGVPSRARQGYAAHRMDTYGRLFGGVLFPVWEGAIRRRPTLARLRALEQSQWRSLDELLALQLTALARLVDHAAKNVPHYRTRFRELGLDLRDIRSEDDILRLPLLTREQAQESADSRRSVAPPFVEIEKATSGTRGRPLSFGYERDSETWRQAVRLRAYGWAGYRPGKRTFHLWGPSPSVRGWRSAKTEIDHALRRDEYFDCSVRSSERLDLAIARIERFRPEIIVCFASAGADLARRVLERGARSWGTIPVVCGAEALLPSDRQAIEEAFGPAVFETYGSREVMLMASECTEHQGLHVAMENVIVEVLVRAENGTRRAAPGEVGEVAVTDLHNHAMPFIRYLNGDLAVAGDARRCACQRQLVRIRSIEGRVTATLRDGSGAPVGGLFVHALLAHVGHAFRQFQAVQHADGSVTLRLVKSHAFDETAHRYLLQGFAKYLQGAPVRSEFLEEIPTAPSGKRQVILREA